MNFQIGKSKFVEMPSYSKYKRLVRGSFSKVDFTKVDGTLVAKEWLTCREYFQDESSGIRRILFVHTAHRTKNISSFINILENLLEIEEKTIVGPTQRYNISWIRASSWWTTTSMKRSLFTILLRCGTNYKIKQNNFEEALFSVVYTKNTRYAVERFIKGHTKYTGKKKGWYNQFYWGGGGLARKRKMTDDEIDKLLIYPNKKDLKLINTL